MFNLVGKRYIFLGISLLIIIPGLISLIFKGLNVGIDFSGGTSFEFRPQNQFASIPAVENEIASFKFSELQVVTGADTSVSGKQNVWVRLNTRIDPTVQSTIQNDIWNGANNVKGYGKANVNVTFDDLLLNPLSGHGKATTVTVVSIAFKNVTPALKDVQALLAHIPDTSDPTKGPATAAASPTPTTGTTATPTSSPTKTSTPVISVSPTATATSGNPSNIPVSVAATYQGSTTQTITLLTLSVIDQTTLLKFEAALANSGNYIYVLDNATVSGSVAAETTRNAFLAVAAAAVFILLYIWFAFRKVTKPWRFGACAIIALLHDVLVVLGVFSILGWLLHIQIDALFITALLTVCGFSVHDTIVVFDRIRENLQRRTSETFEQVVNASLVQTMARSLNTSLTVLFTLSALTLFGGTTIRTFTLALLVGIFSGTYSSIFNASMLLVIWERGEMGTSRFNRDRTPDGREVRELARTR